MNKTKLSFLLILFVVGQAFAQQQTKSFAEYWFGITPQQQRETQLRQSAQQANRAPMLRSTNATANSSRIITLDLTNPTVPTSFDVDTNGVWVGTLNNDAPIVFNDGTFSFSHIGEMFFWSGFTYSRNADNTEQSNWIMNHFGNMAGGGIATDAQGNVMRDENGVIADPDAPYLVAYWTALEFDEFWSPVGPGNSNNIHLNGVFQAIGVYVNNSPWAYFSNISGSGTARALNQEGDFLRLIIHALDENQERNGSTVVHYLAKFENGILTQSRNWEWVDLSALGLIGGVDITMESTDNDPMWGMNTPAYFVMDRFTVVDVAQLLSHVQVLQEQVSDLQSDIIELNDSIETLNQLIVEWIEVTDYLLDSIAWLHQALADCESNGTSNVPFTSTEHIQIFPNPVADQLHIAHDWQPGDIVELFNMNGHRVFSAQPNSYPFTIDMSPFPNGSYILRIGNRVAKIVKR